MPDERTGAGAFFDIVHRRERGKLKVYIGSAAGTGKTFRMLQEAHELRRRSVDVVVGLVETHGRAETEAQVGDLEVVPRRVMPYRGVLLTELDLDAVVRRRPQVVLVDELAHSNVPGSRHGKRWEDVQALLEAGISVITAVNVQHLESLNDIIAATLGVTVRETVPDWVVGTAEQVVNLDISAEDLRQRLREGKIYPADKVDAALTNFFTDENLTTLRELALREVASSVDRTREAIVRRDEKPNAGLRPAQRILVAMSSRTEYTRRLLRRASRIAGRLNSDWLCAWVQTPDERADRIDGAVQRRLVDNIDMAQRLGAEVVMLQSADVAATLVRFARERGVSLILVGQSRRPRWRQLVSGSVVRDLVANQAGIDVLVVGAPGPDGTPSQDPEE